MIWMPITPADAPELALGGAIAPVSAITTLVRLGATSECRASGLQVLVVEASGLSVYPLPTSGTLTIGRAQDCDVRLHDPLASRHHVRLHVRPLAVEDCGSANGTRVGDAAIAPRTVHSLRPGETVSIGSSLLLVQRGQTSRTVVSRKPEQDAPGFEKDDAVVIDDPFMKRLYATIDRVAEVPISVLVLGETGVGKDLVAHSIHRQSPRRNAPFVRINCSALTESLFESEIFGHERGAFSGAVSSKPGLIESADGGTAFLDEVGELTRSMQATLLHVIETREVVRVGGLRPRAVDVRFISATNRDLASEVTRGIFRADLFYRLNGVRLTVPPLRERRGEILALARTFLSRAAAQSPNCVPLTLTPEAIDRLLAHSWPGNVRELRSEMERVALFCVGPEIRASDLSLLDTAITRRPTTTEGTLPAPSPAWFARGAPPEGLSGAFRSAAGYSERERIVAALAVCHGNQTRAARQLGMARRTLVTKLGLYGIPRPRKP
jgi:two-component system response regulator AtoC